MNDEPDRDGSANRSPRILLGVSGSIAIVKSLDIVRQLRASGCEVRVAMTPGAKKMIAPVTFAALTEHAVYADMWDGTEAWRMDHLEWARWAELFLIAPASANLLAGLAHGLADNAVNSTALAWRGPLLIAPAMNPAMFAHPATQENVALLGERGAKLLGPARGVTLCGDEGEGRMIESEAIVAAVLARLREEEEREGAGWGDAPVPPSVAGPGFREAATNVGMPSLAREPREGGGGVVGRAAEAPRGRALAGRRVLITAGATREPIDPVRFITNAASGKTGIALALEAAARGARVELVLGPTHLAAPSHPAITVHPVVTADDMAEASIAAARDADVCIFSAAVADYTPAAPAMRKLKKGTDDLSRIELVRTRDIAAEVGAMSTAGQLRVGFAAETHDLIAHAREKLERKNLHLICANDVTVADAGFGADRNAVVIVGRDLSQVALPMQSKRDLAARILDSIETELAKLANA
jgi:phosphopantothenoylcysteine decarboxylase/phosphopantothenate--cysteine ligase